MRYPHDKILDVAIELAGRVDSTTSRQRDVAARRSPRPLYSASARRRHLCAAMDRESEELERRMETNPIKGDSRSTRATMFTLPCNTARWPKAQTTRARISARASGAARDRGQDSATTEHHGMVVAAGAAWAGFPSPMGAPQPATKERRCIASY